MDLLQGVQDGLLENASELGDLPEGGSEEAGLEKLLEIVKKLNLSVENEEQLKEVLTKKAAKGLLGGFIPESFKKIDGGVGKESDEFDGSIKLLYLLVLVSIVLIILVFFGYKLYKSHVERERKREEKRRLKQQKKKK